MNEIEEATRHYVCGYLNTIMRRAVRSRVENFTNDHVNVHAKVRDYVARRLHSNRISMHVNGSIKEFIKKKKYGCI